MQGLCQNEEALSTSLYQKKSKKKHQKDVVYSDVGKKIAPE